MKTQEQLIKWYEQRLEKVLAAYSGDCRFENYIEFARQELEAVKNGRTW